MAAVDYCIANEEDAEKVFGIKAAESDLSQGKLERDRYVDVAAQLTERFGFKGVAITLRESHSASRNGWSGLYYTAEPAATSAAVTTSTSSTASAAATPSPRGSSTPRARPRIPSRSSNTPPRRAA